MVRGIEKFKEYFADYTDQYVFIGGAACVILVENIGGKFRATKDIDTVLLVEELDDAFGNRFWEFIEAGDYEHQNSGSGEYQFFRFSKPKTPDFPFMIELFSRKPQGMILKPKSVLAPLHIEESIASLSAILLNDAFYQLLIDGKKVVDGYSVLGLEYLILFKIRAWLDLSDRVTGGETIDSNDVKKHKNDVFRLFPFIAPTTIIPVEADIKKDVDLFLKRIPADPPDLRNLGIRSITLDQVLETIQRWYKLKD